MNRCYICGHKVRGTETQSILCAPCNVHEVRGDAINEAWIVTHNSKHPDKWSVWVMVLDAEENLY